MKIKLEAEGISKALSQEITSFLINLMNDDNILGVEVLDEVEKEGNNSLVLEFDSKKNKSSK